MMKKLATLLVLFFWVVLIFAQNEKRPLTTDDILHWKRITETHLSNDGKYIVYQQEPWKGDPELIITTPNGNELATFTGGTNAKITSDSKFVIFTQEPLYDTVRKLKLAKTKKEDLPQNKLAIYNLQNGNSNFIENFKSVKVPTEWEGWIAWQAEEPKDTTQKGKNENKAKSKSDDVFPLHIKNTNTGETETIPAVGNYVFAENAKVLVYVSEGKDSTFAAGIYRKDLTANKTVQIYPEKNKIEQLSISKNGEKVAFVSEKSEKEKLYDLYLWDGENQLTNIGNNPENPNVDDMIISKNGRLFFSENNNRIFYGTAPKTAPKDTTILEEEIPVLDVWHWNEEELQTVQINNKNSDLRKTYLAVYDINYKTNVQLESELFSEIRTIENGDSDYCLAWSNRPYAVQSMWEGSPRHNDFYLVNVKTGEAKMIKKDVRANPLVSSAGKYIYWYNATDTTWNTYEIETGKEFTITTPDKIQVADELNDIPNLPGSYYTGGWIKNDESVLINDRFDVWIVDPKNRIAPFNLTQNGRKNNTVFRVINFENSESRFSRNSDEGIDTEKPVYFMAHNEVTRADSYYKYDFKNRKLAEEIYAVNMRLNTPKKAKNSELVVFTQEDFKTYPDLIAGNLSFKKLNQISDAAPQQNEFIWGNAELVTWNSLDGKKLEGLLYKPENFDPSKKYPMIVNFYEKSSQGLLSYRMPELHRSTIDYHYYTSNGYVVFNPDIHYTEGYPGESAFNCVMPGVNMIIDMGFVDKTRIAAQGHSWGGYQVAYLATRTNLFAAIESGAPVVNMFSAYGGIRWGTGLSRSFQYEHTQSRIGKTIWESPLRYIENSPLFTLDKVETPILIMHNDDDGAVPWYQGIEYFIGLRRLGKPAWLLNYNEADHWPLKIRDKEDFQIRMAQFFNHYLKDEPMPKWMKEGIPAVKKGIDLGYELVD